MGKYVVIDTRDPGTNGAHHQLAGGLADHGDDVTVFLVQNAVLGTRRGSAGASSLRQLAGKATVLADEFSLRSRAVAEGDRLDQIGRADVDDLVDVLLEPDRKVLWL